MASYILRDIDEQFWIRVKTKAAAEAISIKALIVKLLADWLKKK